MSHPNAAWDRAFILNLCFIGTDYMTTVMRLYFCLYLSTLLASGKEQTMKTPKTPVEFDYDLWTTEDGKYMVRVRLTGEVTEVDHEIMKTLRAEEKKLRRSYLPSNSTDNTDGPELLSGSVLSLDALPEDEASSSAWLTDRHNHYEDVEIRLLEEELIQHLTPTQKSVYMACIVNGQTPTDYAKEHSMKRQSVNDVIDLIRKKAKKYF